MNLPKDKPFQFSLDIHQFVVKATAQIILGKLIVGHSPGPETLFLGLPM